MLSSSEKEDETAQRTNSVLLIGSSGGGTATLGHTDPVELLTTVHRELLVSRKKILYPSIKRRIVLDYLMQFSFP